MTSLDKHTLKRDLVAESAGRLKTIQFYGDQVKRLHGLLRRAEHQLSGYRCTCVCPGGEPCDKCKRTQAVQVEIKTELGA